MKTVLVPFPVALPERPLRSSFLCVVPQARKNHNGYKHVKTATQRNEERKGLVRTAKRGSQSAVRYSATPLFSRLPSVTHYHIEYLESPGRGGPSYQVTDHGTTIPSCDKALAPSALPRRHACCLPFDIDTDQIAPGGKESPVDRAGGTASDGLPVTPCDGQ